MTKMLSGVYYVIYLFISYYKFSAVRMGVKKIVRMLDATPLTYFVKISEVNSQTRKVCQWSMQTRVRVRVIWWAMHTCYICSKVNYAVPEVWRINSLDS